MTTDSLIKSLIELVETKNLNYTSRSSSPRDVVDSVSSFKMFNSLLI